MSVLPVDPINDSEFFYTYFPGGSFEITSILKNPNNNSIDGEGSMTGVYITGSPGRRFETPLQRDRGLIGYWKVNEGSGSVIYDRSGRGNHGEIMDSPVWEQLPNGNNVLKLDGINDYIRTSQFLIPNERNQLTIAA